ncbi:MAG: phage major capsid protein [Dehalococcoidales bacterium]|nr:phage major capsid protein [Dehalococcoidales bacterium]
MNKFIRILKGKSWTDHTGSTHDEDTVLEVDVKTAESLIEKKVAEIYDAEAEAKAKEDAEVQEAKMSDLVGKAVSKAIKEMPAQKGIKIHVETKDLSDEDPTFGYLPDNQKSSKELLETKEGKFGVMHAFGQFARDVASATMGGRASDKLVKCKERSDQMLKKAAGDGLVVSSDQDGGYLIFSAASQMMNLIALENSVIRPRATKLTMNTQILQVPYLRDVTHATGTVYGGISIKFDDENADTGTGTKPAFARLEFKLKKMTAMGYASEEWIKWAPVSIGSWMIPRFGEAVGWKEDLSFIGGVGGAQPLGLLNAPCRVDISGITDQDTATFVLENTTAMFARLREFKSGSVVWLMNRTVFPQLPLLNVTGGTASTPVFINSVLGAPGQSLWGYPIVWTEKVPVLGDAKSVVLTDLSDYVIADDQSGPEVAQSIHLKFDYGQTAFRITKYVDGQNASDAAFQPRYGSTLSPVVAIAAI